MGVETGISVLDIAKQMVDKVRPDTSPGTVVAAFLTAAAAYYISMMDGDAKPDRMLKMVKASASAMSDAYDEDHRP